MPKRRPRTHWERSWRPKGAWVFETRDDGTVLFFPHGWGRGYVVPTREKYREIQAYLHVWRIRIRAILRFTRLPFFLTVGVYIILDFSSLVPFFRFARHYPLWYDVAHWSYLASLVLVVIFLVTPVVLRIVAATAKADLEKSDIRRSFVEIFRNQARRSKWWRLYILEVFSLGVVLAGAWLLWLSQTVVQPAHPINGLLVLAAAFLATGALWGLVGFWQMRVKRKSERTDPE